MCIALGLEVVALLLLSSVFTLIVGLDLGVFLRHVLDLASVSKVVLDADLGQLHARLRILAELVVGAISLGSMAALARLVGRRLLVLLEVVDLVLKAPDHRHEVVSHRVLLLHVVSLVVDLSRFIILKLLLGDVRVHLLKVRVRPEDLLRLAPIDLILGHLVVLTIVHLVDEELLVLLEVSELVLEVGVVLRVKLLGLALILKLSWPA